MKGAEGPEKADTAVNKIKVTQPRASFIVMFLIWCSEWKYFRAYSSGCGNPLED